MLGVLTVAIIQPGIVDITGASNGTTRQFSGVVDNDVGVSSDAVQIGLSEHNVEGAAIGQAGSHYSIILLGTHSQGLAANLDGGYAAKFQLRNHLIVHNILPSAGLCTDGGLEIHGLADIRIIDVSPAFVRILLDLLFDGGCRVLVRDFHAGLCGIQFAQSTHSRVDQIVAKLQLGNSS